MFSVGSSLKLSVLLFCVLNIVACSNVNFDTNQSGEISQALTGVSQTDASNIDQEIIDNGDSGDGQSASPEVVVEKTTVEGYATGVASQSVEYMWESFAPKGSTIQLHYRISGKPISVAFQVFKKGNMSSIALDENGNVFSYGQYYNLNLTAGEHVFNLPLRHQNSTLAVGDYVVVIWACAQATQNSCHQSAPIEFGVR